MSYIKMSIKTIKKYQSKYNIKKIKKEITLKLDNKYIEKLQNVSFNPVFILGFHRSGTSILYKMLVETDNFNPITAYHIIKYDQLLYNHLKNQEKNVKYAFNKYLKDFGQTDRGIDRLKISADFPEEYRFLFTENNYKPYITIENLHLFIELCKKIQFISKNNKSLLLKNPFDFPNFVFIKESFPEAKFIFIHRNPINVLNSNIKSINDLFEKKNLYGTMLITKYKKIVNNPLALNLYRFYLILTALSRTVSDIKRMTKISEYYLKNIKTLDKRSYISIRYEDLCSEPEIAMSNLINFLNIKMKTKINYCRYIKIRKTILLNESKILHPYMKKMMKKYLTYFKYDN
jgi:hypothetical protein